MKDLTNRVFGKLTVIDMADEYISPKGERKRRWNCKCECGNNTVVNGALLTRKTRGTKSCGCLRHENNSCKKYNKYDLSCDYGIGYTTKGEEFYFDLEDYDKIKDYCWRLDKLGYVVSSIYNQKKRSIILMHRIILNICDDNIVADHIKGENSRNDNRKINLRFASKSQNAMNSKLFKNNTSGRTGVSFDKRNGKYVAFICVNKKNKFLGYFDNFDAASNSRRKAEKKYFKEYNFIDSMNYEVIN